VLDPEALLPVAGTGGGSTSKAYGSKSPARDALLDTTDRRPTAEGDPRDIHGVLAAWADAVRESNNLPPRPRPRCRTARDLARGTVAGELQLLRGLWWWIRGHPAAGQFARDLFGIRDMLTDLAGESRGRVRIGRCTTSVDVGGRCGQLLLARIGDRVIHCPRCTTKWPWLSWSALADDLTDGYS
jgi:hypothetical protein